MIDGFKHSSLPRAKLHLGRPNLLQHPFDPSKAFADPVTNTGLSAGQEPLDLDLE